MAKATPRNVGQNSVLLFGDYGTEIMRLSQLYDPKKDRYQKNTDPKPVAGTTYYTLVRRDRMIVFEEVEKINSFTVDGTMTSNFKPDADLWKDTKNESASGYYVPVEQTLVVVDMPTVNWGTYTLLIVDRVDPETYESTLKPINFSGNVDTAVRAVDWNNNLLNVFVDTLLVDGRVVHKLTPDRKILAYGSGEIYYLIKKVLPNGYTDAICTLTANLDEARYIPFQSAASFVDHRVAKILSHEDLELLAGDIVQFFNESGERIQTVVNIVINEDGEYDEGTADLYKELTAATTRGDVIRVFPSSGSMDAVTRVQLPEACYLRQDLPALTPGEDVVIEVYEKSKDAEVMRLITTYRCIVRDGSPLDPADLTQGQIVGFNVMLHGDHDSDVWEIPVKTGLKVSDLNIQPVLTLDDGRKVDVSTMKDLAFFMYGIDRVTTAQAGECFDVLFKYYPGLAVGLKRSTSPDTRYIKTTDKTPVEHKRYFIKKGADEFALAGEDGHPTTFDEGETYYVRVNRLSWQSVVNRPSRDFITCMKRVRMVAATTESVRKITIIPTWDNDREKWDLSYLVYKNDFTAPKPIKALNTVISTPLDEDYVVVTGGEPDITVGHEYNTNIQRMDVYYRKAGTIAADNTSKQEVSMLLQHFTSDEAGVEKFLFGSKESDLPNATVNVYGHEVGEKHRPHILCKSPVSTTDTQVYRIPVDTETGFPIETSVGGEQINTFIERFFDAAVTDADVMKNWSAGITAPTHFRIRGTEPDAKPTEWMKIASDASIEGDLGYGNPIVVNGLDLPDPTKLGHMGIVIVEFAYIGIDEVTKVLIGVPVEVRAEPIS